MESKANTYVMADLPRLHLALFTIHIVILLVGPYNVKIGRNKTIKHYGMISLCLGTRAVHLELAVHYSTMEYMQLL